MCVRFIDLKRGFSGFIFGFRCSKTAVHLKWKCQTFSWILLGLMMWAAPRHNGDFQVKLMTWQKKRPPYQLEMLCCVFHPSYITSTLSKSWSLSSYSTALFDEVKHSKQIVLDGGRCMLILSSLRGSLPFKLVQIPLCDCLSPSNSLSPFYAGLFVVKLCFLCAKMASRSEY